MDQHGSVGHFPNILSGKGKNGIHSSQAHWTSCGKTAHRRCSVRIVARPLCGQGPECGSSGSEVAGPPREGKVSVGYKASCTALWEVERFALSAVAAFVKVTNRLVLINPVGVFDLHPFAPPAVSVSVSHSR